MKLKYPYIVLAICTFTWFWNFSSRMIITAILPAIHKLLSLSFVTAGLLLGANFWGYSISQFLAGFFTKWLGRKKVIVLGIMLSSVLMLLTSFATNYVTILILLFFLGFGLGTYLPVAISLISEVSPVKKRGLYIGVHETAAPMGQTVGPILVGLVLILGLGWTGCLRVWIAPAIAISIIILLLIREPADHPATAEQRSNRTLALTRSWTPTSFLLVMGATICHGAGTHFLNLLPLYWTSDLGVEIATAAFITGGTRFTAIFGQVGAGYLSDVLGPLRVLLIIKLLSSILIISSAYLPFGPMVIISLLIYAVFFNAYYPVLFGLISDMTPPTERGKMLGIIIAPARVFDGFFPVIIGFLADSFSFLIAWFLPIVLSFLSLTFIIILKRRLKATKRISL